MVQRKDDWRKRYEGLRRGTDPVRELLEDFDVIGVVGEAALVQSESRWPQFIEGIHASAQAALLGLQSLDYARDRYPQGFYGPKKTSLDDDLRERYLETYFICKNYLETLRASHESNGDPTLGVFGADVVLGRAGVGFFCAHILYRLGHRYEGHAVSRMILEQIAWANAAYELDDVAPISRIKPTAAIGALCKLMPEAGRLYGFLSAKTHIDYWSHAEFITVRDGQGAVKWAQPEFTEYAEVMMRLTDLYCVVYEASQYEHMKKRRSIRRSKSGAMRVLKTRPFVQLMARQRRTLAAIEKQKQGLSKPQER